MDWQGQERRRFPRANFPVKIKINSDGRKINTHTINISRGGIRAILDTKLDYYTVVDIELDLGKSKKANLFQKGIHGQD